MLASAQDLSSARCHHRFNSDYRMRPHPAQLFLGRRHLAGRAAGAIAHLSKTAAIIGSVFAGSGLAMFHLAGCSHVNIAHCGRALVGVMGASQCCSRRLVC